MLHAVYASVRLNRGFTRGFALGVCVGATGAFVLVEATAAIWLGWVGL